MPRKKAAVKSEAEEMTEVLNAKTMERPVLCPSRFRGQ